MHRLDVPFLFFAPAGRDIRAPFAMHDQHEFFGLLFGVAEVGAEHESDIRHQIDRIVPDDCHPRILQLDNEVSVGLVKLYGGRNSHVSIVAHLADTVSLRSGSRIGGENLECGHEPGPLRDNRSCDLQHP